MLDQAQPILWPIDRPDSGKFFYLPARAALEADLAEIVREVLGCKHVTPCENFLKRGEPSLLAARIIARLQMRLHVHLLAGDLFANPSIRALAAVVESEQRAARRLEFFG